MPWSWSLVFTLEPLFAAVSRFLVLGERLGPVQLAGAALILLAVGVPALERGSDRRDLAVAEMEPAADRNPGVR